MNDIVVQNISKTYNKGEVTALKDISFTVKKGELFGLIGPDGAGKTSLFRILTSLLLPDGGTATVNGSDILKQHREIRRKVGYMPGRFSLYQDLSVEENLKFFASIFNTSIQENYHLIEDIYVQLAPFKTRKAGALSGGMKQKLALCCALIHKPEVLFLDEPTTGVDAVSRKEFWEMLRRLKQEQITILVSTPYMDEANLCERIALIQNGSLLSVNTPQNIIKQFPHELFAIRSDHMSALLSDLRSNPAIQSAHSFGDYHHITFEEAYAGQAQSINFIDPDRHKGLEIKPIEPSVEDCFIHLMTKEQSHAE